MPGLENIQHIVVLMLENRSFDHMLGFLYDAANPPPRGQAFDGLTGNETNPDQKGQLVKVFKITTGLPDAYYMPGSDPGEGYYATNIQHGRSVKRATGGTGEPGFRHQLRPDPGEARKQPWLDDKTRHHRLEHHGRVHARDVADHVGPGPGICRLGSLVRVSAHRDAAQPGVRRCRDLSGAPR